MRTKSKAFRSMLLPATGYRARSSRPFSKTIAAATPTFTAASTQKYVTRLSPPNSGMKDYPAVFAAVWTIHARNALSRPLK